jgi:hypothetical protein
MSMTFDTKIAVVLRDDLPVWQKLNVTAFTVSGIAAKIEGVTGEPYEDGSGHRYLPMFKQPVLIFSGDAPSIRRAYERARERALAFSLFTEELFSTGNDIDNRAAMKAVPAESLRIVGMALRAEKKTIDKVLKGLSLHR